MADQCILVGGFSHCYVKFGDVISTIKMIIICSNIIITIIYMVHPLNINLILYSSSLVDIYKNVQCRQ